jgi:hypothetical protein
VKRGGEGLAQLLSTALAYVSDFLWSAVFAGMSCWRDELAAAAAPLVACFQLTPAHKGVQNTASLLISDAAGLLEGPTADILTRTVVHGGP